LPERAPLGKYIQPTNVPGLSVLTSGRNRNAGSNLLYGPWLPELFDRLRVNFDTILIDTPPVLLVADARVLGRNADGVVVVCRARSTDRERAKVAVERLFADGAHVIGTILNDFDPRTSSYYGQYYGKQYAALPEDGDIPSMN